MGIAAFIIYNANDIDSGKLLRIYLLQLFFNALWPIIFFRLKWQLFAFFWLVTLIALVSLVMAGFRYIRKTAYWLILPYFIWLIYAAYLNLGFYLLNR
jgi:tryptophan-rich sensory protein